MTNRLFILLVLITLLDSVSAIELKRVNIDFELPVLLTHANDERLFIVEKSGRIYSLKNSSKKLYLDASSLITTRGNEQGLLALAFHPDFSKNGYLFIFYTAKNDDNTLARLTVDPNSEQIDLSSLEILIAQKDPASNHNGGMLTFGHDGYLYVGFGDGGRGGDPWNNAQNLETYLGKLLRIDVNQEKGYSVPLNNPFVEDKNAKPEIWSYGLRNPWRHSVDKKTGDIWIADVGQNKWEEVHFQSVLSKGGENYGWKIMEANHCFSPKKGCDTNGLVPAVAEYSHKLGCSITGGYVYRGAKIKNLVGKYLFGDFCTGYIWTLDKDKEFHMKLLMKTDLNISSFGEDPGGELYVIDYKGAIYKMVP